MESLLEIFVLSICVFVILEVLNRYNLETIQEMKKRKGGKK